MNAPQPRSPQTFAAGQWLILAVLLAALIAGQSVALHNVFTSRFPSGNDFFVRWLGGRELLLHGVNPYDRSVAEQAQTAMFGRLTRPEDKDEAYFAYPLYTLFFFWPLSFMPYAWAQAVWMTLLQFMLLAATVLAVKLARWQPPGWLFGLTVLWGILFYNGPFCWDSFRFWWAWPCFWRYGPSGKTATPGPGRCWPRPPSSRKWCFWR